MDIVVKYRKFIRELVDIAQELKNVEGTANNLRYAIENDCVDWNSIHDFFTGERVNTFIDKNATIVS